MDGILCTVLRPSQPKTAQLPQVVKHAEYGPRSRGQNDEAIRTDPAFDSVGVTLHLMLHSTSIGAGGKRLLIALG